MERATDQCLVDALGAHVQCSFVGPRNAAAIWAPALGREMFGSVTKTEAAEDADGR